MQLLILKIILEVSFLGKKICIEIRFYVIVNKVTNPIRQSTNHYLTSLNLTKSNLTKPSHPSVCSFIP
jgi:hypothetical protein